MSEQNTETTSTTDADELATLRKSNSEKDKDLKALKKQVQDLLAAKEAAEEKATEESGNIEAIKKQLQDKHDRELNKLKADKDQLESDLRTIRVDSAISNLIAKSNVISDHVEVVEALLHRRVEYTDGVATIDGKSIEDYGKAYFAKAGAVYVNAPNNSGGGITGNDGTKATTFELPKSAADVSQELLQLASTDPAQYNSIMTQAGLHEMKV